MKLVKLSTCVFVAFFLFAVMPELSARSSFSFNLNLTPVPRYVEYNYVAPAPAYVVRSYPAYYSERVYYPRPYREVVVERPYAERVYVQPGYSYWGY